MSMNTQKMLPSAEREPSGVWPPTIKTEVSPIRPGVKTTQEWASIWLGSAGLAVWLCVAAIPLLVPDETLDKVWIVTALNASLLAGPLLALTGAITGWLNRRTKLGRAGLVLSSLVLTAMLMLFVAATYSSGHGLWFQKEDFDGICGCG